jgi:lipoprotein NlpI
MKRLWFVSICAGEAMATLFKLIRMHLRLAIAGSILTLFPSTAPAQSRQESPQQIFDQAVTDFRNGRITESVAGFDRLAELVPVFAPELWQRGIALYYANRYRDCRAQFESHRTVNPNDVENAAWHFLCVARAESPARARSALLPVGPDSRVPMMQIYEMFKGTRTAENVLTAAGNQASAQFYAHLYVGLYFEAIGDQQKAREHITQAAAEQYAGVGGYMHMVARIHVSGFREIR